MPISFNSNRIVGIDRVDRNDRLRQLNGKLVLPATRRVTASDLVVPPRLQQVDVTDLRRRAFLLRRLIDFRREGERSADSLYVLPARMRFTPTGKR